MVGITEVPFPFACESGYCENASQANKQTHSTRVPRTHRRIEATDRRRQVHEVRADNRDRSSTARWALCDTTAYHVQTVVTNL